MIAKKSLALPLTIAITALVVKNLKSLRTIRAPIVVTTTGKVEGIISVSRDGRDFFEYLKIPYAKPPVGYLRFEPPEPPEKWEDIRDASEYGPKCLQIDLFVSRVEGEEDCLHLNVHTPKINLNGSDEDLLPVMVWIHGGLFVFGSGNLYRPTFFMDFGDVVLVTINYRLASFGFMNTGDGIVRGNMGLKDQNMALRWVQDNIQNFGGNPNSVTIFGESAGGASCHFHKLSPMSRGLFHKVISQSGLATMPWALNPHPAAQAKKFAAKLNCTTKDTASMVQCLKSLPADEIVNAHSETMDPLREIITVFVPTIEIDIPDGKTFLSESPDVLIANGNFSKVPFLTGVDSHEGLINSAIIFRNETVLNLVKTDWGKWMPRLLYLQDDVDQNFMLNLRDFYAKDSLFSSSELSSIQEMENVTNMFSDRFWNIHFHHTMKHHVQHSTKDSPVYLYYYTYLATFSLTDILLAVKGEYHPIAELLGSAIKMWLTTTLLGEKKPRYGVCHGDSLFTMFYVPFPLLPTIPPGHPDYHFSREFVKVWIDFATNATNQTTHLNFMGTSWTPQKSANDTLHYMKLDQNPLMIREPFDKRIEFWDTIISTV